MWTFDSVARIEQNWNQWSALVTLTKDGLPESFYIKFHDEPTDNQVQSAGVELALKKNLEEAPNAPSDSMAREDFFGLFTNAEIAAIYRASQTNDDLFAYVKKLEINPTVNKNNADVIGGLQLLEQAGLLASGRADQIRGV